jgi:PmbA protein
VGLRAVPPAGRGGGGPLSGPAGPAAGEGLAEALAALGAAGLGEAEVFAKRGRSRRLEHGRAGQTASYHRERGWAVRAGDRRSSFFAAGTGALPPGGPWPAGDGHPLRLPDPVAAPPWSEPSDFDSPLVGEREGLALLASLEGGLAAELPGARVLAAVLEDGSSESELGSSRGIAAAWRSRTAALRIEAAAPPPRPGGVPPTAVLYAAEREARRFNPPALARRLADLVTVVAAPAPAERDRGEVLAAPAVGSRLLAGLLPLFVGPGASHLAAALRDRRGRVASGELTVVDHGRLPGGLFEAPCDGEGVPTRETVVVEEGSFRQPLVAWHQARRGEAAAGCSRRASWRDLPRPGPTHLFIRPRPGAAVASLLGGVSRGYYLLDAPGPGVFDFAADRFHLPVAGFAVVGGRAVGPVGGAALTGGISSLLRGVAAVGRDLAFAPLDGMLGAPSLLLTGLEIQPG